MSERGWLPRLGFPACLRKHLARQPGVTPRLMAAMLENKPATGSVRGQCSWVFASVTTVCNELRRCLVFLFRVNRAMLYKYNTITIFPMVFPQFHSLYGWRIYVLNQYILKQILLQTHRSTTCSYQWWNKYIYYLTVSLGLDFDNSWVQICHSVTVF